MNSVGLIATDIDGTMIRSDGTLSARVKAAMHAAVSAGIPVVPATGRPMVIAHDVIEAAELHSYWIFANGAVTRHMSRDELVRGFWLEQQVAESIVSTLRDVLPEIGFAVEFETDVAFEKGFEAVVPMTPDHPPIADISEIFSPEFGGSTKRIQKVLAYDLSTSIDELYQRITEAVGESAVASYSGLPFIELAAGQVTKATALSLLASDLGIEQSRVVAFGDNHNDIPMLEWAGTSYAMANATDDAKAAANEVIASNDDDGVALKIEELLEQN